MANDETESSDDTSTTEGADHIIDTDTDVEEEYLLGNQERNRNDIQIKKTDFQNSQEKLEKISNSKFLKDESPAEVNNIARRINTDLTMKDIAYLLEKLESLLEEVNGHQDESDKLNSTIANLNTQLAENNGSSHEKVRRLESQNALLREKSMEARKENDILVEKIQSLHSKLSTEVRVSISGIDEMDSEDPFFGGLQSGDEVAQEDISLTNQIINQRKSTHKYIPQKADGTLSPELVTKKSCSKAKKEIIIDRSMSYSGGGDVDVTCSSHEAIIRSTEKKYEDSVEKIMRLEQRIVCLQNANNLNSCATCRPLRKHVMKIERQLLSLVQERKSQLEELFLLKQVALSSAISEKDAHLAWLEATEDGNVHTMSSIEKLRKERREILNRMKEENENRMKLLAKLEDNPILFTGPARLTAIGALGENYVEEENQSTSSVQSSSAGELGDIHTNPIFLLSPSDTPPTVDYNNYDEFDGDSHQIMKSHFLHDDQDKESLKSV